ncbi:hypothetical protein D3C78_1403990 [compost metagenome]
MGLYIGPCLLFFSFCCLGVFCLQVQYGRFALFLQFWRSLLFWCLLRSPLLDLVITGGLYSAFLIMRANKSFLSMIILGFLLRQCMGQLISSLFYLFGLKCLGRNTSTLLEMSGLYSSWIEMSFRGPSQPLSVRSCMTSEKSEPFCRV